MKEKCVIILSILLFFNLTATAVGFFYNQKINNEIIEQINNGFYLNGKKYIVLEYGSDYKDEGFTANLDKNKSPNNIKIKNNIDIDNIGDYTITYTLNYKNQIKTLVRNIKIVDTVSPKIKLNCEKDQYIVKNTELKECSYEVSDNYDKNIKNKVEVISNVDITKYGDYTIKYIVTDSSGNKDSQTINVYVRNKFDLTYINVYISKQRLDYYQNNKIVLSTPITSGRNNYTKTGSFKIRNKVKGTVLKGKDYVSNVKYWMAYNGNSFGIHDASWRRKFGTMDYKKNGSHGCINVPTSAMKKLYKMVEVGTPVYIMK